MVRKRRRYSKKYKISELKGCPCLKAVVSGSSKEEIETILDENIGSNNFDFVISGDDLKKGEGKPDPGKSRPRIVECPAEPGRPVKRRCSNHDDGRNAEHR